MCKRPGSLVASELTGRLANVMKSKHGSGLDDHRQPILLNGELLPFDSTIVFLLAGCIR